jgi:formylglycine-generating enzyme required for sulfatase activity
VPGGRATLSDRRTERSWPVDLAPYRLSALPVTRAQYASVTGEAQGDGDRLPVESVSWWDAVRHCNARSEREGPTPAYRLHGEDADGEDAVEWNPSADGYRLPTEAIGVSPVRAKPRTRGREHACRAGTTGPRHGPLDEIAWYRGNSGGRLHDADGRRPNAWGLYDMLGNVWEWCWDVYDPEVYGSYRVLRGGGWFDEHGSCRASVRRRSHPATRIDDIGFRVARSVIGRDGAGRGWAGRG